MISGARTAFRLGLSFLFVGSGSLTRLGRLLRIAVQTELPKAAALTSAKLASSSLSLALAAAKTTAATAFRTSGSTWTLAAAVASKPGATARATRGLIRWVRRGCCVARLVRRRCGGCRALRMLRGLCRLCRWRRLRGLFWLISSFDGLKAGDLQRQLNGSGCLRSEVGFAGRFLESELRDFNAVVARRQARQIELAILVGPTDKRASACRIREKQRRSWNRHAANCANLAFRFNRCRSGLRCCGSFLCFQRHTNRPHEKNSREEEKPLLHPFRFLPQRPPGRFLSPHEELEEANARRSAANIIPFPAYSLRCNDR